MRCGICTSDARLEIDGALRDGLSQREIGRRFGFGRDSIFRHASLCLKLRRTATSEARAEAALRHKELSGDLDEAYSAALLLQTKAEESGDIAATIKMQRHVARLLQLRTKAAGKLLPEVSGIPQKQYRDQGFRALYFYPEELHMFASSVRKQPSEELDVPTIGFRIMWQKESRDFPAPDDRATEAEAALAITAEVESAKALN